MTVGKRVAGRPIIVGRIADDIHPTVSQVDQPNGQSKDCLVLPRQDRVSRSRPPPLPHDGHQRSIATVKMRPEPPASVRRIFRGVKMPISIRCRADGFLTQEISRAGCCVAERFQGRCNENRNEARRFRLPTRFRFVSGMPPASEFQAARLDGRRLNIVSERQKARRNVFGGRFYRSPRRFTCQPHPDTLSPEAVVQTADLFARLAQW